MRKRIISESFENRMHELSGIIEENAHKIMKLGFDSNIADYLAAIDKKRGMFFADSLTQQYIKDSGNSELEGMSTKRALALINQAELFSYMKSRENEIAMVSEWVKASQGQVNLKDFSSFNELVAQASEQSTPIGEENEEVNFESNIEDYLRGLGYDFGIEVGKVALKDYVSNKHPELNPASMSLNELIPLIDQNAFYYFLRDNENEISAIIDWASSSIRQEEEGVLNSLEEKERFIASKGFDSLSEALFIANDWHTHLAASGKIMDINAGKVVERYPDGYYWMDLGTNNSPDEGQAMGHCGVDGRATTLISLRDEKGEPHVTLAYNEKTKNIGQVKGKNNKRPVEKYMNYVNDFLGKMVKNDNLTSFNWSYPVFGPDLNSEEVEKALNNLSAKAKFKIAKRNAVRKRGGSNLGVRY